MPRTLQTTLLMTALVTITSCASVLYTSSVGVDEIIKHQQKYVGREVSVRGYLLFGDDAKNLWTDKQSYARVSQGYVPPDDPAWNKCITLSNTGSYRQVLLRLSRRNVLIKGTLRVRAHSDTAITIGECSDTILSVEEVSSS